MGRLMLAFAAALVAWHRALETPASRLAVKYGVTERQAKTIIDYLDGSEWWADSAFERAAETNERVAVVAKRMRKADRDEYGGSEVRDG